MKTPTTHKVIITTTLLFKTSIIVFIFSTSSCSKGELTDILFNNTGVAILACTVILDNSLEPVLLSQAFRASV